MRRRYIDKAKPEHDEVTFMQMLEAALLQTAKTKKVLADLKTLIELKQVAKSKAKRHSRHASK